MGTKSKRNSYTGTLLKKLRKFAKVNGVGAYKAYKNGELSWGEYVAVTTLQF